MGFEKKTGLASCIKFGGLLRKMDGGKETVSYDAQYSSLDGYWSSATYFQVDNGFGGYLIYKKYLTKSSAFQFGFNMFYTHSSVREVYDRVLGSSSYSYDYNNPLSAFIEIGYSLHFAKNLEVYFHGDIYPSDLFVEHTTDPHDNYGGTTTIPQSSFHKHNWDLEMTLIINSPILFKKKRLK